LRPICGKFAGAPPSLQRSSCAAQHPRQPAQPALAAAQPSSQPHSPRKPQLCGPPHPPSAPARVAFRPKSAHGRSHSPSAPCAADPWGPLVIPELGSFTSWTPPPPPPEFGWSTPPPHSPHGKESARAFISCTAPRDGLAYTERRRNPSATAFDSLSSSSSRHRGAAPELRQEVSVAPVPFIVDPVHPVALGPSPEFHRRRRRPFEPCLVFTVGKPFLLPRLSSSRRALRLGENREANRAP
jgi:hypothetical protein